MPNVLVDEKRTIYLEKKEEDIIVLAISIYEKRSALKRFETEPYPQYSQHPVIVATRGFDFRP